MYLKIVYCLLLMVAMTSFVKKSAVGKEKEIDANEVLTKMLRGLNSLNSISYSYFLSINYFSEDYHSEIKGKIFLDFDKADTLLGLRFQVENDQSKIVYNGNEDFFLEKKDSTIRINYKPTRGNFENFSFFVNSLVTIKNVLPSIISNREVPKTIADTVLNKKSCYAVSFVLENKSLNGLGDFLSVTLKRNFMFKIIIDKKDNLPLMVIQTNSAEPKDYLLTTFSDFKTKNISPSQLSWYHSTYSYYKPAVDRRLELIKKDAIAPEWKLPYFNNGDTVSSHQLNGKFVLMEFWMKNCGYCIMAVPKLNSIAQKYSSKKVEVLGVNPHDKAKDIEGFYKRNEPLFNTVIDEDGKVAASFGVDVFPVAVLIDAEGKVLYAGEPDEEKLEKLLNSVLQ